jgi:hypothetical protein
MSTETSPTGSRRKLLLAAAALAVLVAAAWGWRAWRGVEVATKTVQRRDLVQTVVASGRVQAPHRADIAAQIEKTERMGLSKEAIAELDAAKLEMLATDLELQAIKAMDRNLDQQTYDALKKQAAAYRELGIAKKGGAAKEAALEMEKANKDAAQKAQDEWQKATDQINQSLTDALMRGFESGKDFAKNMRDTIVNMFKTMVLRPIISAVLSPIAGGIQGLLGGVAGGARSNRQAPIHCKPASRLVRCVRVQ